MSLLEGIIFNKDNLDEKGINLKFHIFVNIFIKVTLKNLCSMIDRCITTMVQNSQLQENQKETLNLSQYSRSVINRVHL